MRGHDLNLQTFSVARTTVRLRHLLPRKSLESVFHFSAVTSGPVSIGTCGKNWRDIVDDDKKKKWGHMVPVLRSCVGQTTFPPKEEKKKLWSQWRLEEGERHKGAEMPSVIQQAVTHPIYLPVDHRGPVSCPAGVPTRHATPKVRSTLTFWGQNFLGQDRWLVAQIPSSVKFWNQLFKSNSTLDIPSLYLQT